MRKTRVPQDDNTAQQSTTIWNWTITTSLASTKFTLHSESITLEPRHPCQWYMLADLQSITHDYRRLRTTSVNIAKNKPQHLCRRPIDYSVEARRCSPGSRCSGYAYLPLSTLGLFLLSLPLRQVLLCLALRIYLVVCDNLK